MAAYNGKTDSTAFDEYISQSGFKTWLEEQGVEIIPSHNAQLASEYFERKYEQHLLGLVEENQQNGLPVDDFFRLHVRLNWLQDKVLPTVERWLSKTEPDGKPKHPVGLRGADIIERKRFQAKILAEITVVESQINNQNSSATNTDTGERCPALNQAVSSPTNTIFFVPEARQSLYDALEPFVYEPQRSVLKAFINGNSTDKPIIVHCQQNEFGAAFFRSGAVPNKKARHFSQQLPAFFSRHNGRNIVAFSPSTLEKHLRGIDLPKL